MTALTDRASEILKRISGVNSPVVAEIGVREAKLSAYLLNARRDLLLYAVDNWLSSSQRSRAYKETGDKCAMWSKSDADAAYQSALDALEPYENRVEVIRKSSGSAANEIPDQSLDLVFLDADHSEKGITRDIEKWRPKVKPGGCFGGHDYANPAFDFGVEKVVSEIFGSAVELGANFTWWVRL